MQNMGDHTKLEGVDQDILVSDDEYAPAFVNAENSGAGDDGGPGTGLALGSGSGNGERIEPGPPAQAPLAEKDLRRFERAMLSANAVASRIESTGYQPELQKGSCHLTPGNLLR